MDLAAWTVSEIDDMWEGSGKAEAVKVPDEVHMCGEEGVDVGVRELDIGGVEAVREVVKEVVHASSSDMAAELQAVVGWRGPGASGVEGIEHQGARPAPRAGGSWALVLAATRGDSSIGLSSWRMEHPLELYRFRLMHILLYMTQGEE
jgi:hypothetical protein